MKQWTIVLSYLLNTRDSPVLPNEKVLLENILSDTSELDEENEHKPEDALQAEAVQAPGSQRRFSKNPSIVIRGKMEKLFSPPFIAIVIATILANVSSFWNHEFR